MPRRSVAARVPLVKRPLATLARDYRLPPYAAQAAAYADTVGADALDRHYTERRDVPRA